MDPADLRAHAAAVRRTANRRFWSPKTGRFVGAIGRDGVARDYGFTFVNLDAIWYGLATPEHARSNSRITSGQQPRMMLSIFPP